MQRHLVASVLEHRISKDQVQLVWDYRKDFLDFEQVRMKKANQTLIVLGQETVYQRGWEQVSGQQGIKEEHRRQSD